MELIYLITYEGQTESVYTWTTYDDNYWNAVKLKEDLEKEYPDRVWSITEKDVS